MTKKYNPNHLSELMPDFTPATVKTPDILENQYKGNLKKELKAGTITKTTAIEMLEDMFSIREFEEMIIKLRSGAYDACSDYNYRGPTHVSIGQEATAVGGCTGIDSEDLITSTHRGHGDSIAKGCAAIRGMSVDKLKSRIPETKETSRKKLIEEALEDHIYKTIAELFGKEDGYCKGRGGGMHIADFAAGHLGANAIVGGGVPIATGSALAQRYLKSGKVVCCFAGDGAYANGVVLETLNFASMSQFSNHLAQTKFGLPIIFVIVNNHYGMTGRADEEVTGIQCMARRAAGFADNNLHAETVNGMDVMAVKDAIGRASDVCRAGNGPCLVELDTYRYYGHSLSDPRNEYRTRAEEAAWKEVDPIDLYIKQLIEAGVMTEKKIENLREKVVGRNGRAAAKAAAAADPDPADVIKYMYTDTAVDEVPEEFANAETIMEEPKITRVNGELNYKDALKEAMLEEMKRDKRVILYGEDVADYGGAFKVSKGLLETFGRDRIFNSPISEAAICGAGVGAAMSGLRPIVELMYMDFALQASDQISNQAAKWHYMSGAKAEVPVIYRASVGGGKGYGGQHSQTLEAMFAHMPGLYVMYPCTPYDAKGMLKSAIRDNNPIMFIESQLLYGAKGVVPEEEYLIEIGTADVKKTGTDITFVAWGPAVLDCLKAAEELETEGISAEVVDLRYIVPLDMETVIESVKKTGKCVVASQAISMGSFTAEVASQIMNEAFDYLDAPVVRVGAKNGIAPQSYILEAEFMPNAADMLAAAKSIL
jgi:2-oxoisovalerate dehydrogenase E1 component